MELRTFLLKGLKAKNLRPAICLLHTSYNLYIVRDELNISRLFLVYEVLVITLEF